MMRIYLSFRHENEDLAETDLPVADTGTARRRLGHWVRSRGKR